MSIPWRFVLFILLLLLFSSYASWLSNVQPLLAAHTDTPDQVTVVGNLQDELGCAGDWQPECAATQLAYDGDDDVWQMSFTVPAGTWEYKVALNNSWDENYGAGGEANGANIGLTLSEASDVKFYYDHKTHWVTDNVNSIIATVPGSFQSELGCPGDWDPGCLRSWLQDADGDGLYAFETEALPAGDYEAKVAHNESWDENYGAGGEPNGANILFTVGEDEAVVFTYDPSTHNLTITTEPIAPSGPASVTIAGNLQDELGCSGDWQADCAATHLSYDAGDDVWQERFNVPAGNWEYKATLNDSWDENYGAGAEQNGPNIALSLADATDVKFYYDHKTHWVTDNVNSVIATVPGSFQSELGCPGDWDPGCLRSWLQDADGDGLYAFETDALPAGDYEAKVAHNEAWDENYGAGGQPDGANILFSVPDGARVLFSYDPASHLLTISTAGGDLEPGDEFLVRPPVRAAASNESFYFVLPDRFDNGDPTNDWGDATVDDPLVHGYLPENKGYYHGGDLTGLRNRLDYLDNLGVSAIWMTPQFKNAPVQGDGTIAGSSAAYHGYWQIDYTQIDPHFGTNQQMKDLIAAAHDRGIKVFFDVVINHTGDVISYEEGTTTYRSKADYPYLDADGVAFDDRDYAGSGDFPALDPANSFPYTPLFPEAGDDSAKQPAWLNNPIYYHNRGDSTFVGESSLYGDFFGLDDLFTEHPDVVEGMIEIHKAIISEFGVDGFRVDTVKHVNDELWAEFVPAILAHAQEEGLADFFLFGEIFSGEPGFVSRYTTELDFPGALDFGFDGAAKQFASGSGETELLQTFFANDDYYTDEDSNAHTLVKFIGNHDIGRLGHSIAVSNPSADDAERVARSQLAHGLMYLSRGIPLIYYGDEQGFVGDGDDKDARQDMMPSLVDTYNDDDLIGTTATTAEANFDETHVLYETFSALAQLRADHEALRQGAQIHRYSQNSAGVYAFSRIERDEQIEYVVALNNGDSAAEATFTTYSPDTSFTELYPGGGAALTTTADGTMTVGVPPLSFVVYRAQALMDPGAGLPQISLATPETDTMVSGRVEVAADVVDDGYAEVTFAVSVSGDDYEVVGTDDSAPYRVFYNTASLAPGTPLTIKAIVADAAGNLNAAKVAVEVGEPEPPASESPTYAVIHYLRDDGDYGDHTTGDFNDFWGLHLWEDIDETIAWTEPKPFLGEDEYGRFAWVKLAPNATNVGFIVHRGDVKDGTTADRFFNPSQNPEIWLRQDDSTTYTSQAEAQKYVTIHYRRSDGEYGDPTSDDFNDFWGLHLWGDALAEGAGTEWTAPRPFDGIDPDFGAFWKVPIDVQNASQPLNFIIHRGDSKDPGPDQSLIPVETAAAWIVSGDETIYPQRGAALQVATIHYHRDDGDYGDPTSADFNDFWGLHVWEGARNPNPGWTDPLRWDALDVFGPVFNVPLTDDATQLAYIIHRGDTKDPGPDQFLVLDKWGYEVWQLQGEDPADPETPHYVLPILGEPGANPGNINEQRAYWVDADTILWAAGDDSRDTVTLHYASDGGLETTDSGVIGGSFVTLTRDPDGPGAAVQAQFPHLANLPALRIDAADLQLVPAMLKGQLAVSAVNPEGLSVDATGLQIPGVLDDLYTYQGELGVTWEGDGPTIRLWAPTAKSVTFHLFADADPATDSTPYEMTLDPESGVWSITGESDWTFQYYLFEVEVYVHSTGQVEHNLVTDPYSLSLAMNSARSQIVDLDHAALKPAGWDTLTKPSLEAPEDIVVYEIHVRDFSAQDPAVPEELQGTYKAFTLDDTYGVRHLRALQADGLTHLHLLPIFDIATINENKAEWQAPDPAELAQYPPDGEEQQEQVALYADDDGFNWGYDPWHYTTPEGSYSTDPNGATRIIEFREMVQALNEMGLRVVMDVVYNHTNAAGQAEKSVLDRIVPGYYHRLNDQGQVETSTCCANTASEHNMMEKLMIDSLLVWAEAYKVDAFRFDLMGHHMKENMLDVRAALNELTPAEDGVNGQAIYLYGEGWNFGEVADGARGVNATQLNMAGTGIGTFSDRLRDAVRGGGPFDGSQELIRRQGFANGLYYDPNALNSGADDELDTLLLLSDQIRVGMAGNLADYLFIDRQGNLVTGAEVDYNGQPAGYTADPQEDITYISKHDNQTLYDINVYKTPVDTTMTDRVRLQYVGLSTVMLGQGVPFIHAGSDLLRSKSMDRDSFNSGDWFNKLDFSYEVNNFGVGLPVAGKNADNWPVMLPFLANPDLQPGRDDIMWAADLFQELLAIRRSSELFRLETADEVQERVLFHNTGPAQLPGLIVMSISDKTATDLDRVFEQLVVVINANDEAQTKSVADLVGAPLALHPQQRDSVDPLVRGAHFDPASGAITVPGRTVVVFVEYEHPATRLHFLAEDIRGLVEAGMLNEGQGSALLSKLEAARASLDRGGTRATVNQLEAFINQVDGLARASLLSAEHAQALTTVARDIIWQIEAGAYVAAGTASHRDR
ncbi:MAG: pullulanase-type alpha-1,6-glucosidase [Candidatus Promineifilaceae bacterium]|nr:pullulanase-type alpha-1,6-glucosidase [Candidatus Promineifilaceae bacterium]